jgi:beta-lactamase class A
MGLAGLGAVALGCTTAPSSPGNPVVTPDAGVLGRDALRRQEARIRGSLGVYAFDTGTQAAVGYRAGERFLLCSTGKTLTVAAVLKKAESRPGLLDQLIRYRPSDVLDWAPVTSHHVGEGMTVAALCDAAITVSDNTAANLLVGLAGGPPAVTAFARSVGDAVTRIDRLEPDLNVTSPGDLRDTSTPEQMAKNLVTLVLGDALKDEARERLAGLLKANTTGDHTIRAGVPRGWVVADKTGTGAQGESNDIAVVWPPHRAPLVLTVYAAPGDPRLPAEEMHDVIAKVAGIATAALVPDGG